MSLASAVEKVQGSIYPTIEGIALPHPIGVGDLLSRITEVRCTPEEFEQGVHELSTAQARTLLTATLHRSLAYGAQLLPLENARSLADELIVAAGPKAKFFSNCDVVDEVSGVGSWTFMVTSYTFESVLYCVGERESALLVAVDED